MRPMSWGVFWAIATDHESIDCSVLICTDDTMGRMQAYQSQQVSKGWLPLRLLDVPASGKSPRTQPRHTGN